MNIELLLINYDYYFRLQFEQKRGHVASSVECYMKQYGVSEEEAYIELRRQIKEAWKDINEDFIAPRAVPIALLTLTVNYTHAF